MAKQRPSIQKREREFKKRERERRKREKADEKRMKRHGENKDSSIDLTPNAEGQPEPNG